MLCFSVLLIHRNLILKFKVLGTESAKFSAVSGSDTMIRNGLQSTIATKHQCITAMNEYDSKSFEELRIEDYLLKKIQAKVCHC